MSNDIITTTLKTAIEATTKCTKHLTSNAAHNMNDHVDHSAHVGHGSHNLHDGMIMSFHGGYDEVILFDFWNTQNSVALFILSCVALFIMAVLYEGIKLFREKLIRIEIAKNHSVDMIDGAQVNHICHCNKNQNENSNTKKKSEYMDNNGRKDTNDEAVVILDSHNCCSNKSNANAQNKSITLKSYSSRVFSKGHIIQTLMHMLQITVSYLLMLVFMTYNSWLCLSVVLGAGLGYFLFGLKRLTTIDVNEHCH